MKKLTDDGWMIRQMMDGCWMNKQVDECVYGWMNDWMLGGWIDR